MKAASLNELKSELKQRSAKELVELALRLARYKKENKELLTYLLFEADDEAAYIQNVTDFVDEKFSEINATLSIYFNAKSIRKILRTINKFVRFSGSKNVEVRLLLHFCERLKNSGIDYERSTAMNNLYDRQLQKINKAISALHEDAQYDYKLQLEQL
jgi:transcriptional regulatory protein LevR